MRVAYALALAGLATMGCTGDRGREVAVSDSLQRDLELAPTDTLAPDPLPEPGRRDDSARTEDRRTQAGASTRAAPPPPTRSIEPRVRRRARTRPTTTAVTPAADTAAAPDSTAGYAPTLAGADTSAPSREQSGPVPEPVTPRPDTATPRADSTPSAPAPAPAAPSPAPTLPATTAPTDSAAPSAAHVLPAGTEFRAQLQDTINSLRNAEGQTVTALVSGDVRAPDGLTVLPSGSKAYVYIARLRPARSRSAKDGELQLRVDSIVVGGRAYAVRADVGLVPHELRGRGVTAGEVEKVGAGAAAGAVVGGVVTGKTKGAVIGGVIGAAGGTVVAAQTASRDVVVTPGTLLPVVLREPVTRR